MTTSTARPTSVQDWLHIVIVGALAAYLVIGVIAWTWMLLAGIPAPAAFTTVLSTIAGGLIGILAPIGRSPGSRDDDG
jgi:integral membrane sensor domain MASE1